MSVDDDEHVRVIAAAYQRATDTALDYLYSPDRVQRLQEFAMTHEKLCNMSVKLDDCAFEQACRWIIVNVERLRRRGFLAAEDVGIKVLDIANMCSDNEDRRCDCVEDFVCEFCSVDAFLVIGYVVREACLEGLREGLKK